MAQTISAIILLILTLLGIVYCIRLCILAMLTPPKELKMSLVIPVSGHIENIEYIVRCAIERKRWYVGRDRMEIILLDCGMDDDTIKLCNEACKEYGYIKIQRPEMLKNGIMDGLQKSDAAL